MKFDSTINLRLTQESGQTSQSPWKEKDGRYCDMIYIDNVPVIIKAFQDDISSLNIDFEFSSSECYCYESIDKVAIEKEVARIFDLNFDLDKFYKYLSEDYRLKGAIDFCRGLRLFLAKDPFETIVSSIVSANNSIVRWTKSITKIRKLWGTPVDFLSGTFYSFPSPSLLMSVHEDDFKDRESCMKNLKACGVGYRAHYIKKTSELLALDEDLFEISNMKYNEAFEKILSFPGIGPKVADCILLYGFGFKEAFPTDIWIKRIVSHLYFNDKDISVDKIRDFGMEQFRDYAGYVQLYLFHYARKSGIMKKLK